MALDTDDVLNAIINVLKANTSTIVASLTSANSLQFVKAGDVRDVPVTIDQYPCVIVRLASEIEEFSQLGQRNNKHELEFEIANLIYNGDQYNTSETDIRKMTKGVKAVLKNNITLSSTALWSLPERVDYFPAELEGTYLSASLITLRTHHLST